MRSFAPMALMRTRRLKSVRSSLAFWSEDMRSTCPGNDWIWLLLFLVVGYPFVLFLLWFEQRNRLRDSAREAIETLTEPQRVKTRRCQMAAGIARRTGGRGWRCRLLWQRWIAR